MVFQVFLVPCPLANNFLNSEDSTVASYTQRIFPALGWNMFDGAMLGFHLQNREKKKWDFHLVPMYSFGGKSLSGIFCSEIVLTEEVHVGLQGKRFLIQPMVAGGENVFYNSLYPYVGWKKRGLKSENLNLQMRLGFYNQFFEENFDLLSKRKESQNPNYFQMGNQYFQVLNIELDDKTKNQLFQLEFEYANTFMHQLNGILDTLYENGQMKRVLSENYSKHRLHSNHIKVNFLWQKSWPSPFRGKKINFRYFISAFLEKPEDPFFYHWVGQNNGFYDYRFEEYQMGRGATNGLFYHQIMNRGLQSKFVGRFFQSDAWLSNLNIEWEFPGVLPVGMYGELLTCANMRNKTFNSARSMIVYNGGLVIHFPYLNIYVNFFQSQGITQMQLSQGIDTFTERMVFQLNLNKILEKRKIGSQAF